MASDAPVLLDKYIWAKCCRPALEDAIIGYFSPDDLVKVHRRNCANLSGVDQSRLVSLEWAEILSPAKAPIGGDFADLEPPDFAILQHHLDCGIDYSLAVAAALHLDQAEVFQRHQRLRELGLLERVQPLIVQYRKGIVDHKWIKHRNHTYYQLTAKGRQDLEHHRECQ